MNAKTDTAPKTADAKPAPKAPLSPRRAARAAAREKQQAADKAKREAEQKVVRESLAQQSATHTAPPAPIARIEKVAGT